MKHLLVLSAAVGALAASPSAFASPAQAAADTVIAKTTGGVLVANARGTVTFVHAHARVGSRVVKLGSRVWVVGLARTAHVRGVVVASRGNMLVLTAAHRLFTLGLGARRLASDSPGSGPQAGEVVGAVVSIDANGNITATSTEDDGPAATSQVQATITAVTATTVTLDVNGSSVTLQLPAGTPIPATSVGTQVTLTLTFAGGSTTATEDDQGEDQPSTQGSGEDGGQSGSGTSGTAGSSQDDGGTSGDNGGTSSGSGATGSGGGDD